MHFPLGKLCIVGSRAARAVAEAAPAERNPETTRYVWSDSAVTCFAAFAGHDPASEVGQYVILTSSGRRLITACRGCADAALAMGIAIRPDERHGERGTVADRRVDGRGRPELVRRVLEHRLPLKVFR